MRFCNALGRIPLADASASARLALVPACATADACTSSSVAGSSQRLKSVVLFMKDESLGLVLLSYQLPAGEE